MKNVGIVIVSHSSKVAEGTADMVRQMVGDEVPLAHCGGDPSGGLGTSVEAILAAIEQVWSDRGVAILVDLGGAETNSELVMAFGTISTDSILALPSLPAAVTICCWRISSNCCCGSIAPASSVTCRSAEQL